MSRPRSGGAGSGPGRRRLGLVFALLSAASLAAAIPEGRAGAVPGAAAPGDADAPAPERALPAILAAPDIALYGEIFALQRDGRWRDADARIRKLGDGLLLGHVLAQRYLHPTKYWTQYRELRAWLARYADHPDAPRLYRLALKRRPAGAKAPRAPTFGSHPVPRLAGALGDAAAAIEDELDRAGARAARPGAAERALRRRVQGYARREYLTVAERFLAGAEAERMAGRAAVDRARAIVAAAWFRRGDSERAYRIAAIAAKRSGAHAPRAHWWAGLAAFRLGCHGAAARHFEDAAASPRASARGAAAAAFWAARAHLVSGNPRRVNRWLAAAARHPYTFYGMMAAHIHGAPAYDWRLPSVEEGNIAALAASAPGRRAFALVEAGERRRAEAELRGLRAEASPALLRALVAAADAAGLPATALRGGKALLAGYGERYDAALYPLPRWPAPEGGHMMDRALIYALARQESGFNARATSASGARGLLQLMPATARFMAGSRRSFLGARRAHLYDIGTNLDLGQRYMDHLLTEDVVAGNLLLMVAAYNGGPGNLARWQRQAHHDSDPLIFIESIPVRETRRFVRRVFENLWIYRARLGQEAPSLASLAGGRWPLYVGLDGARLGVAEQRP